MTKRFTLNDLDNIQDNNPKGRLYILTERGGVNALCNLINGLNDKSNRLEKENKQLKQFKFNTLKLIDKNIKKYQNHLEDVEDDAVCPERYIWEIKGHLQALTELKEALNE